KWLKWVKHLPYVCEDLHLSLQHSSWDVGSGESIPWSRQLSTRMGMWRSRDNLERSLTPSMWDPGIKLTSSALDSKCLYFAPEPSH
ncbi:mCG1027985, partial [Mus musculus]